MADEDLPQIIGNAGLTGRSIIARHPDSYEEPWEEPHETARSGPERAMPPNCLRTLNSPLKGGQGGDCRHDCPGRQRDGGCLLDIVKAANAAGVRWKFDVDPHDHFWDYDGEPIPGLVVARRDFGQIHTTWEPGFEPEDPYVVAAPKITTFECPHCGATNQQDPANFHYWCQQCGKNAKEGA